MEFPRSVVRQYRKPSFCYCLGDEQNGKSAARLVAENAESYGWGNLTLAVQLLLPLALIALIFARKKVWIYPYPLLDTYISALCPSFSQQQRLLKWMSSRIPHMNNLPNKITQYWQNGSLLCTLINTVVPGACPNPQKHWKKPPTHGQALAYKYLGVAPVLTESDLNKQTLTSYSERKFIKYLLSIQEAINKVTIEEDTLKFTSKYVARGMGLVIGEQNRSSVFYIYPNISSNKLENILVNIKGPYNTFGSQMISSSDVSGVKNLDKVRRDNVREQTKLGYKSKAQRSFFRSVSFDIGPIINLMSNKKNTGEISVNVEMEDDRAKVTFLPKFSGIYELLLTNEGQHLQGSPFIIRIMKNNKEIEETLGEKTKSTKNKIERKIIGKSIDFINESVTITDELHLKLDSNNNANTKDVKELTEPNKSDDESTYQDSGVFDISDQSTIRSRQTDLEEIDEDSRFSEISDSNATDESRNNSLDYKIANDSLESSMPSVDKVIEIKNEETERIIIHRHTPNDIKFLTDDFEEHTQAYEINESTTLDEHHNPILCDNMIASEKETVERDLETDTPSKNLEQEIFEDADLQSNQEFENLYKKYANDKSEANTNKNLNYSETNSVNDAQELLETNDDVPEKETVTQTDISQMSDVQVTEIPSPKLNSTDFEILSNIPQYQKGRKITSSVEKIVEIFEKDSSNRSQKKDIFLTIVEAKISQKPNFTVASPVLENIVQEAFDSSNKIPVEDSAHLKREAQLSSSERRPVLSKDYSVCLDDDELFDTNVKEIKNIFEQKQPKISKKQDGFKESKRKLAKSLPNLLHDKDLLVESDTEDEFVIKFKEKRNFWNNLILKNSSSSLNVSTSDINSKNTKLISKQYENVSQSTNSLNTFPRSNKLSTANKWTKRKEDLYKTTSLDLTNTYDDNTEERTTKITRAKSLYDRIRVFDKDFDSGKHSTLLKRTKERSDLKEKIKHPEVLKPESLTEVPNKTSNDQIEEDLRFAEIMKERFEISRRYFCSLESLTTKPNLTRRHSMGSKTSDSKEIILQKGGSLKVLNAFDKFSLDNIYKDVVLSKLKNCNFRGSPNKEAVVETLSSVSSSENDDFDKNKEHVEEDDLNMQFFNIKKRLRKRRSIRSIFDVNY